MRPLTQLWRLSRLSLVGVSLLVGACQLGPTDTTTGGNPGGGTLNGDGTLYIAWTIGGQAPSTQACAGVDHLVLTMDSSGGDSVQIDPIPCPLTKFRYDQLPDGEATVRLDALDASGCSIANGQAQVLLPTTVPANPTPIAISALTGCR